MMSNFQNKYANKEFLQCTHLPQTHHQRVSHPHKTKQPHILWLELCMWAVGSNFFYRVKTSADSIYLSWWLFRRECKNTDKQPAI